MPRSRWEGRLTPPWRCPAGVLRCTGVSHRGVAPLPARCPALAAISGPYHISPPYSRRATEHPPAARKRTLLQREAASGREWRHYEKMRGSKASKPLRGGSAGHRPLAEVRRHHGPCPRAIRQCTYRLRPGSYGELAEGVLRVAHDRTEAESPGPRWWASIPLGDLLRPIPMLQKLARQYTSRLNQGRQLSRSQLLRGGRAATASSSRRPYHQETL